MKTIKDFLNKTSTILKNKVNDFTLIGRGGFNTVFEVQYDGPTELVARVVTVHNPKRYTDEELELKYNK
jgi:hypothetical protein